MSKNTKKSVGKVKAGGGLKVVAIFILIFAIVLNAACVVMADTITLWLCSTTSLDSAAREKGEKLATQMVEEGIVLVKNEEKSLPLDKDTDTKVNVFGWAASEWIGGGSGSGRVVDNGNGNAMTPATSFLDALEDAGIEYNKELITMYENFQGSREYWSNGTLNASSYQFHRLYEPSIKDANYYTTSILSNATNFSDTAIVVLGRASGESNDPAYQQYKRTVRGGSIITDSTRTYLDISTEEEELLQYVADNFQNVIVVINSTNTMNLNFMDSIEGLSSCLIVGGTGNNAANGLVNVLYGVSPSGRVVDTYAYDFATAAAYAHAGETGVTRYQNSKDMYPASMNKKVNGDDHYKDGATYLDYQEGIYVGYKWYETADAEGYWKDINNKYGEGYEGVVQYPFGYGMSYTTFAWDVVSTEPANGALDVNGQIKITVRVTNTGDVAGKEVVQAYYTAPYTKGGIEKSSVVLAAFAKTPVDVEPGESQDLTLTFDVRDMASYDSSEIKVAGGGYILEEGEYTVKLMKNSHELAEVGVGSAEHTYTLSADYVYKTDAKTGNEIHNLFTGEDAGDGISIDGSTTEGEIEWLTRANFGGTFQSEKDPARAAHNLLRETNLYDKADATAWDNAHADVEMPTQGKSGDLRIYKDGTITELGLELGGNYNSEKWDDLLDQISVNEMKNLTAHGYVKEGEIKSVGKDFKTNSVDGPSQPGSFNQTNAGTGYPHATVLAQSWNSELAKSFGASMAADARAIGYEGLYAPGVNIHRSPFGGRNYEYYSEDSYLTGTMGASVVNGMLDGGVYVYVKHFILNEQDTCRDGMYTWLTEQALRELYVKPFKMLIDDANVSGLMSGYGRLGAIWCGGSETLLSDLLRTELGFQGTVITDYADHHQYMNGDQMIRAGGDLWMDGVGDSGSYKFQTSSAAVVSQLRSATKNILYTALNADYRMANASDEGITISKANTAFVWWPYALAALDAVMLIAVVALFAGSKKKKKAAIEAANAQAKNGTKNTKKRK